MKIPGESTVLLVLRVPRLFLALIYGEACYDKLRQVDSHDGGKSQRRRLLIAKEPLNTSGNLSVIFQSLDMALFCNETY